MRNRVRWEPTQIREIAVPLILLTHNGQLSIPEAIEKYGWDHVLLSLSAQFELDEVKRREKTGQDRLRRIPCAFISYRSSSTNVTLIRALADYLQREGFEVLYDRDHVSSENIDQQLPEFMRKLNDATLFIQVVDEVYAEGVNRPWIEYERESALTRAAIFEVDIVTVLAEGASTPDSWSDFFPVIEVRTPSDITKLNDILAENKRNAAGRSFDQVSERRIGLAKHLLVNGQREDAICCLSWLFRFSHSAGADIAHCLVGDILEDVGSLWAAYNHFNYCARTAAETAIRRLAALGAAVCLIKIGATDLAKKRLSEMAENAPDIDKLVLRTAIDYLEADNDYNAQYVLNVSGRIKNGKNRDLRLHQVPNPPPKTIFFCNRCGSCFPMTVGSDRLCGRCGSVYPFPSAKRAAGLCRYCTSQHIVLMDSPDIEIVPGCPVCREGWLALPGQHTLPQAPGLVHLGFTAPMELWGSCGPNPPDVLDGLRPGQ